jgi:SrtB family sortase
MRWKRGKLIIFLTAMIFLPNVHADPLAVTAADPVSIGVNVVNKLDVVLSGTNTADAARFEQELRACLGAKSPSVRPKDLLITAIVADSSRTDTLIESVRKAKWRECSNKFIINFNQSVANELSDANVLGELLNRLRNDNISYIGWSNEQNALASNQLLAKNDAQGVIVKMVKQPTAAYEEQLQKVADKIYAHYRQTKANGIVRNTAQVVLDVSGGEKTETVDLEWPDGKWKVIHNTTGFDNHDGKYENSGKFLSDLDLDFRKSGRYDIYYKNKFVKTIISHKAPIADFQIEFKESVPIFTNHSMDPDDLSKKESVTATWFYLNLDRDTALTPGLPQQLKKGEHYLVGMRVKDKYGALTTVSRQIYQEESVPFADFTISPSTILTGAKNKKIFLTDRSYDLQGLPISSSFLLEKEGQAIAHTAIAAGENNVAALEPGDYSITLTTHNQNKYATPITKTFSVVADKVVPYATVKPLTGNFTANTAITVKFSDPGGSGLKQQRIILTDQDTYPAADRLGWSQVSSSDYRTVVIKNQRKNYLHYEVTDQAGNVGRGTLGPYLLTKQNPRLILKANRQWNVVYPEPLELVATFDQDKPPTGTVFFMADDKVLGSAVLIRGLAYYTYYPKSVGEVTLKAVYEGDQRYNAASSAFHCQIKKNASVSISIADQVTKEYDGKPFEPTGISVSGTKQYRVEFVGRERTSYQKSTSAPSDAGKYKVMVTTTDPGFEKRVGQKNFEIKQRQLSISLLVQPTANGRAREDVNITAKLSNVVDIPTGKIRFNVNEKQLGSDAEIVLDKKDGIATTIWSESQAGIHQLTAEYVTQEADNYSSLGAAVINDYEIKKKEQVGFGFTTASITKMSGDDAFVLPIQGGQSQAQPTFQIVKGKDIIVFDANADKVEIKKSGMAEVIATKPGDDEYAAATAAITIYIKQEAVAKIEIEPQLRKEYDALPYQPSGIIVTGTTLYKVEYQGRNGTTYLRTSAAPVDAGEYSLIVTTTDPNVAETTAKANFEIAKCQLTLEVLVKSDAIAENMYNVDLLAQVDHAVDIPAGKIKFSVNDQLIDTCAITSSGNGYQAETRKWKNVAIGDFYIIAEYVAAKEENYTVNGVAVRNSYNPEKSDQTDFRFTNDGSDVTTLEKKYGDREFAVTTVGGQSSAGVSYKVTSGIDVISVDDSSGMVKVLKAGTAVITATKPGDSIYNETSAILRIHVAKEANELAIAVKEYRFGEIIVPEIITSIQVGMLSYQYVGRDGTAYEASTVPPTDIGYYRVEVTSFETINYLSAAAAADFEIVECDCRWEDIDLVQKSVSIGYFDDSAELMLRTIATVAPCQYHTGAYQDTVSNSGANVKIVDHLLTAVNADAGRKITVELTGIMTETGKKIEKTVAFHVEKEAQAECPEFDQTMNGARVTSSIGNFPRGAMLKAEYFTEAADLYQQVSERLNNKYRNIALCDIWVEFQGGKVQPRLNTKITIYLPISVSADLDLVKIWQVTPEGNMETISAPVVINENGRKMFRFQVTQFVSYYAIAELNQQIAVTGLSLDESELSLEVGKTVQLNKTVTPENATDKQVIWQSDAPEIVTVDDNGMLIAKAAGTAKVVAVTDDGRYTAASEVTVPTAALQAAEKVSVNGMSLDNEMAVLAVGNSLQLEAKLMPQNVSNRDVVWHSSNPEVAVVDDQGLVSARKNGTATITATSVDGEYEAECEVTTNIDVPQTRDSNYLWLWIGIFGGTVLGGIILMYVTKKGNQNSRFQKVGSVALSILLVAVGVSSIIKLLIIGGDYITAKKEYTALQQYAPLKEVEAATNILKPAPVSLEAAHLIGINPDYRGWIQIEGSQIDYPIVQGNDNKKYLGTTFSGKENPSGAIFLDSNYVKEDLTRLAILYGHNMQDGSMFADLKQYLNEDYLAQHPQIKITNSAGEVLTYRIFTVRNTDEDEPVYRLSSLDAMEKKAYFASLKAPEGKDLIALSTCTGGGQEKRILVFAAQEK